MGKRILMATDVPFWRAGNGAQQRIASIASWLQSSGQELRVLYIGDQVPSERDRASLQQRHLQVEFATSDRPPRRWLNRLRWHWAGLLHQWQAEPPAPADPAGSLRLSDYRWAWAQVAFAEAVAQFRPDVVWIEYLTLGYLLEGLPPRRRAHLKCVLDTHDVLHRRADQFRQRGLPHWLDIDRTEEAAALAAFDVIVAIQPAEAQLLAEMAPRSQVVVCGHWTPDVQLADAPPQPSAGPRRIGFLGSLNRPNQEGLKRFLEQVWYPGQQSGQLSEAHLVIGGAISQVCPANPRQNIVSLGRVDDLAWFYHRIDFAINPVEFGTGQKIKGIEALAYARPLITTEAGAAGLPAAGPALQICPGIGDFGEPIRRWLDPTELAAAREAAWRWAREAANSDRVFHDLAEALHLSAAGGSD